MHEPSTVRPDPPRFRYDGLQRAFHWSMALIIVGAIGIGLYCSYLPPGTSPRRELLDLHKSLGMTAAVLIVFRIAYRLFRGEPRYRAPPSRVVHALARIAHLALYGLMILMPVTGYIYSGAGGYSLPWFGLFSWPRIVPLDKMLSRAGFLAHEWLGWTLVALLVLHVLAVGWHGWLRRDEVRGRMIGWLPDRPGSV